MPATLGIAGTWGKENSSLIGGNTGVAAGDVPFSPSRKYGVEPGRTGVLPGDAGTVFISAPPGGAVGADDGIAETPGNENSSFPGGIVGATASGEILASGTKPGGVPGTGVGTVPGPAGTSTVSPATDAAIARRSASVNGPGCVYAGDAGILGTDSATDVSLVGADPSNLVTGISSDSSS